jgi:tetratricopeptide (TPR) repeat protein
VSRKRRLLLFWGLFVAATLALSTGAVLALLEKEGDAGEGLALGVTDVLARSIPPDAPRLRFTAVEIDFHHFPGTRTRRLPEDMGSGAAIEDFDGDGRPDIFLVNMGPLGAAQPPCAIFRNLGDFRFERVDTPMPALMGMGAAAGDYDADGDFDICVAGYGRSVLLRNDGGFRFADVTAEAGVAGGGFCSAATWGDADGDGDLDLYLCRYVDFDESMPVGESRRGNLTLPATLNPSSFQAQDNLLCLNDGGRFREAAAELRVANPGGKSLGAIFADFDRDGVLDLYVANDVTDNAMFLGRRGKPYEDVSHASCTADGRGAMGLATADADGDGDLDLFITHWKTEENALYVREDGFRFRDDSLSTYLGPPGYGLVGWATEFVDFDLDARPDLYVVNGSTFELPEAPTKLEPMHLQLFWNGGDRFFDLAQRAGAALQRPVVGRGGAAADLDADGDADLLVVVHGGAPLLLRNDTERRGGWLAVEARGSAPNLFAYGASITVEAGGRMQVQQIGAKVSYLSSGPHEALFGLGAAPVARVVVRFPSGRVVERSGIPAGTRLVVKEVDARVLGPAMDRARDLLAAGRTEEARRELRAVVALDPTHPAALYTLAQIVEPREALALCLRLLEVEPMAARGHLLRAQMLSDPHEPDLLDLPAALAEIEKARALNGDETGGGFEEGRILFLMGATEKAAEILARVRQNPRAASLAALCLFRLGRDEEALALLGCPATRGPDGILDEGDTARRLANETDDLTRLLLAGAEPTWDLARLPLEAVESAARVPAGTWDRTTPSRLPPCRLEEAVRFAIEPPAFCDGPPPGATAVAEADADGDGDTDLLVACGGDPTAPLPWWLLAREPDGRYRPIRGDLPHRGSAIVAVAAADLDGDGTAEILLKESGGDTWIASRKARR